MPSTRKGVLVALLVLLAGCGGTGPTGPTTVVTDSTAAPTTTATATTTDGSTTPPTTEPLSLGGSDVAATNATLCAGDSVTVTIAARDAGELRFEGWVQTDGVSVDWGEVTASPPLDRIVQTLPPYYVWNPIESRVTLSVPVTASGNATPGTYPSNVTVWHDLSHSHENGSTTSVTVRVRKETACA